MADHQISASLDACPRPSSTSQPDPSATFIARVRSLDELGRFFLLIGPEPGGLTTAPQA